MWLIQTIAAFIPWWLYVAANGAIVTLLWVRFGARPAVVYAAFALVWVAYDKGGDDRDAFRAEKAQQEYENAVERADAARGRSDVAPAGPDGLPNDGHRRD